MLKIMIPENWAEKLPPHPHWGKIVWHQIYPFEAILSNFGFCGRKAPPHEDFIFIGLYLIIQLHYKSFSYTFATTEVHRIWIWC